MLTKVKDNKKKRRAPWDEYFMKIAIQAGTRSTCDRKHVGAVIVRQKTILSTGYNGSVRGMPHCDDVGHMMENDHCIATVHAEANAIIQAAKKRRFRQRGRYLRDRLALLALFQADRQQRHPADILWGVLSRPACDRHRKKGGYPA